MCVFYIPLCKLFILIAFKMGLAGVAQSVEQLICNQQVAGSSPIASSSLAFLLEGFPSGQREQTVNLPAEPTEVRILPPPPGIFEIEIGGSSSVARASAFQAEGRGFESRFPLQIFHKNRGSSLLKIMPT